MSATGDAAMGYARAGFPVFPVRADKSPLTAHGFKDATTDEATIRDWWSRHPDAGIGMPTGAPSGVVVLDVDPRNGGDASMDKLLAENGILPRGPIVRTGGGGEHRWFAHPGGTVPPSHGFLPGLDLQGDGSYVILPPSPHKSGNRYEWVVDRERVVLPLIPPWLFRAATEPLSSGGRRQFEMGVGGKIPHGRHHDYIVSTAASFVSRIAGIDAETLRRKLLADIRESLDDPEKHEGEVDDAVRSALGKFYRPPPPESVSTRTETEGAGGVKVPVASAGGSSERLTPPPEAERRVEVPIPVDALFYNDADPGDPPDWKPRFPAFLGWFRQSERFLVPIERGTFSTSSDFELLRYDGGYYNGMARAFLRGRTEDAFRAKGLASKDGFREEVVKGIGATSELHRRRSTFNPPNLICLGNGVLEPQTGVVHPHSPDLVFTWRLPVAYDPSATCPRFAQFLEEIMPDERKRELLVDLMGYCLWRENPFQLFFVLVGDGANGKTTFGQTLGALLGKEAVSTLSLQQIGANRFAAAELEGRLVNLCDDLPYDKPLAATGVIKVLTGGGSLTVERKHQHPFELVFGGKLVSMANRTPPTQDDTYAFWRRAVVIPFEQTFAKDDPRRDPLLAEKLLAELPGILNLALRGLARVRSRQEFDPHNLFSDSEEEWRRRADPIRAELLDGFELCPGAFVTNARLYEWHVDKARSEDRDALTERAFGQYVTRAFPTSRPERKMVNGKNTWGRPGIRERVPSPVLGPPMGTLDIDFALRHPISGQKAPETPLEPATAFSRESGPLTSPVLAGGLALVHEKVEVESRESTKAPARTGDEAPSRPPPEAPPAPPPEASSEPNDDPPPPPPPDAPPEDQVAECHRELLFVMRSRRSTGFSMDELTAFLDERKWPRNVSDAAIGRACGGSDIVQSGGSLWRLKEKPE